MTIYKMIWDKEKNDFHNGELTNDLENKDNKNMIFSQFLWIIFDNKRISEWKCSWLKTSELSQS